MTKTVTWTLNDGGTAPQFWRNYVGIYSDILSEQAANDRIKLFINLVDGSRIQSSLNASILIENSDSWDLEFETEEDMVMFMMKWN